MNDQRALQNQANALHTFIHIPCNTYDISQKINVFKPVEMSR